jgi:acyl carrier protein
MITGEEVTAIIAECMSLQMIETSIDYDTEIVIDSFGFVWLQHLLEEHYGLDLQQPGRDVMQTLNSARSVHRYLAEINPDRFAAVD